MWEIGWEDATPERMIVELREGLQRYRENKYTVQVGLKDVEFDINQDKLEVLGLSLPFRSIAQAVEALGYSVIQPVEFVEDDGTEHQVLAFDPRPVGYSGFMDCVTHSLALTDKGLFEVGRYPAVSLVEQNRYWQWFLHRRLATPEELHEWQETHEISAVQFLERVYTALTGWGD